MWIAKIFADEPVSENEHSDTNMRPTEIQISLYIRGTWSESSMGQFWIAKDAMFLRADNEDSDKTVRMRRLTWVFVRRTLSKGTCSDLAAHW